MITCWGEVGKTCSWIFLTQPMQRDDTHESSRHGKLRGARRS
jgi:hypothetical protein